jgi:hypothetical protein
VNANFGSLETGALHMFSSHRIAIFSESALEISIKFKQFMGNQLPEKNLFKWYFHENDLTPPGVQNEKYQISLKTARPILITVIRLQRNFTQNKAVIS